MIEDDEDDVVLTREYLSEIPNFKFELDWEVDPEKAKSKIVSDTYHIFFVDYRLGRENGLELIKFAREKGLLTPVIMLTGQGDLNVDIDASRYGATDYLIKTELNAPILERSIRYAIRNARVIQELDEKEKRYRSLFERSVDPIFLANEQFELVDFNVVFLELFGDSRQSTLGRKVDSLFSREKDFKRLFEIIRDKGHVRDFETYLKAADGQERCCLINCVYIPDQTSDFCCYQGIIHDLTLRKKAENDLLMAEKLSMTGRIARSIAHEVRNPLTNLTLALEQLRDELPKDNEDIRLYCDIIDRNSNRIEQLIGEMLNSSKPKQLNLELTDLNVVIEDALQLAVDRINLNQMKLEKHLHADLPRLLLDREEIKMALLNIIINAIEAMDPGMGVLRIRTDVNGNSVQAAIEDNGKGISPENIERLFDPFFTSKADGMGLGLTSTKNILNSHNVDVNVSSTPGIGTTFTLKFTIA